MILKKVQYFLSSKTILFRVANPPIFWVYSEKKVYRWELPLSIFMIWLLCYRTLNIHITTVIYTYINSGILHSKNCDTFLTSCFTSKIFCPTSVFAIQNKIAQHFSSLYQQNEKYPKSCQPALRWINFKHLQQLKLSNFKRPFGCRYTWIYGKKTGTRVYFFPVITLTTLPSTKSR